MTVLLPACGTEPGSTKLNKVTPPSAEERQQKATQTLSDLSDDFPSVTSDDNPITVMQEILEPELEERMGDLMAASDDEIRQLTWSVERGSSTVMVLDHGIRGQRWLVIELDNSLQPTVSEPKCEEQRESQTRQRQQSTERQRTAERVQCDQYEAQVQCLDDDVCENVLVLVYNVTERFVLPIYLRSVVREEIDGELVLPLPQSVLNGLDEEEVISQSLRFHYYAMIFSSKLQLSGLEVDGQVVKSGSVVDYAQDRPAELVISTE